MAKIRRARYSSGHKVYCIDVAELRAASLTVRNRGSLPSPAGVPKPKLPGRPLPTLVKHGRTIARSGWRRGIVPQRLHRIKAAQDAAPRLGTGPGPEAPGHRGLDLRHPNRPFGRVVREAGVRVAGKDARAAFPCFARRSGRLRMSGFATRPRRPFARDGTSGGSRTPCTRIVRHLLRTARHSTSAKAFARGR